jgi:hypothetical protein
MILILSLVKLLDEFKPLLNDSSLVSVASDIEVVIRGLTSLKAIRNFIPRTGNPSNVHHSSTFWFTVYKAMFPTFYFCLHSFSIGNFMAG